MGPSSHTSNNLATASPVLGLPRFSALGGSALSKRLVLHIGAMKTGTTFLQTTLERNSALLRDAGIDFTGNRFAYQTRAVSAVLKGRDEGGRRYRKWRRLVAAAREAEQDVSVVSMEFLSFADDEQ